MVLKEYEEEYVASLETLVQSLQKERRYLETRVQDLVRELEVAQSGRQRPSID